VAHTFMWSNSSGRKTSLFSGTTRVLAKTVQGGDRSNSRLSQRRML